ncbi:hypothetical protein [Fluviibacterium sp. S390]|uniref:hypothetical protein n=1 Tax=Fluviibacterium sp. S390 TaxID=3415139 RepID=UPI003C7B5B95
MMIQVALAIGLPSPMSSAPSPGPAATASIAEFSRDLTLFDSGAARGGNSADIPLSGSTDAPDGARIMAEILRADTGAVLYPAQPVATAAGGSWTGAYPGAARSTHWLRPRVWVEGHASAKASTTSRFGVGHIVGLIGQSEDARMFADNFSQTAPLAVTDDSAVQVIRQQEGGTKPWPITIEPVTAANPVTASVAALADVLIRNAPGEKFLILDLAHSGTSRGNLANDSDFSRDWVDFAAIVAQARADGSDLGLVLDTWTAADSAAADMFRQRFYPFYAGITAAGADYTLGTAHQARTFDHVLWDLSAAGGRGIFDAARTPLLMFGPHRFEVGQDMRDAVTRADGSPDPIANKQDTRLSIRNMLDDAALAPILAPRGKGPEILLYQNGYRAVSATDNTPSDTGTHWDDASHPAAMTDDGLPARARHVAVTALHGLGLAPIEVPRFNRAYWEPSGAWVELWFEDASGATPPVTTTRAARGLPAMPTTYPHRTEVLGFEINGIPAENATLAGGRVRIAPNGGGLFTFADSVQFGRGGASGVLKWPEDKFDGDWMNLPMVDLGLAGVEGVALEPLPLATEIANTLPAPATFTTTGAGPYFNDPGNLGANPGLLTMAARLRFAPGAGNGGIFAQSGGGMEVTRLASNSALRINLDDSSGAALLTSHQPGLSIPENVWVTLLLAIDLPGQTLTLWKDGVETQVALPANTGQLVPGRFLTFLNRNGNGGYQFLGEVEYLRVWKGLASVDANEPATPPSAEITGPDSALVGHPWRKGG